MHQYLCLIIRYRQWARNSPASFTGFAFCTSCSASLVGVVRVWIRCSSHVNSLPHSLFCWGALLLFQRANHSFISPSTLPFSSLSLSLSLSSYPSFAALLFPAVFIHPFFGINSLPFPNWTTKPVLQGKKPTFSHMHLFTFFY